MMQYTFDSSSSYLLQILFSCLISISTFIYISSVYIIMIPSLYWFNYVERKLMFYVHVYIHVLVCLYVFLIHVFYNVNETNFLFKGSIKLNWTELNWTATLLLCGLLHNRDTIVTYYASWKAISPSKLVSNGYISNHNKRWRPHLKVKVSFYWYFCCFCIHFTQINIENFQK